MQNEKTELRNQVRTIKRVVCLVCCLFVFGMIGGCNAPLGASDYNELSGKWETNPTPLSMR